MPFQRRFDPRINDFIIDRDLTGPPVPVPTTGTVQASSGNIIGDAADVVVPPATPIKVTIPGINEPVVMNGSNVMSPRWWRFFEELYRRTGAIEDNINSATRLLSGSGTTGSMALLGIAPTIQTGDVPAPSVASLSIASVAPVVVVA